MLQRNTKFYGLLMVLLGTVGCYLSIDEPTVEAPVPTVKQLQSPDRYHSLFGQTLAMSGDGKFIVVGDAGGNDNEGAARVYTRQGVAYDEGEDLEQPRDTTDFGYQVAISENGTRIVISDSGEGGVFESNVYVYTRRAESWGSPVKLDRPPYASVFGASVAISADGHTIVVGDDKGGRMHMGEVTVYHFEGTGWDRGETMPVASVGYAVALSREGSVLVAAAKGANEIHVLQATRGRWFDAVHTTLTGLRIPFSDAIAVSEQGRIIVSGNVVFQKSAQGEYGSIVRLATPNEAPGTTVAISSDGDTIVWADSGSERGEVRIFRQQGSAWSQGVVLDPPEQARVFGSAVAINRDGTLFAVGDRHGLSAGRDVFNGVVNLYP